MKIAFCLFGKVGGKGNKSGSSKPSQEMLEMGHSFYKKNLFDIHDNVDVFVHSWDADVKEDILNTYKPKEYIIEDQIKFSIPKYVRGTPHRKQCHYSRWYSTKIATSLYDPSEYDMAIVTRFDIAWQNQLDFSTLNRDDFYVGNWCAYGRPDKYKGGRGTLKVGGLEHWLKTIKDHGFLDFWFISNPAALQKFGNLYDNLNEYNKPGNCPTDTSNSISNHRLAKYHADKLNLNIQQELYLYKDFPLIRRHYFGCNK